MDWNNLDDDKQAELTISYLLLMAGADHTYDPREISYIKEVAKHLRVGDKHLEYIYQNYHKFDLEPPADEAERMAFLYYMLFLMKADKNVTEKEENLIYNIGFRLGFNELMIRDLLIVVKKHLGEKIPAMELINKVKKYLN